MLYAVLSGFILAVLAPTLNRAIGHYSGILIAALPAALTLYFLQHLPAVNAGEPVLQTWAWYPDLGIQLSFILDGLSLMFALLISFIGTFIMLYASAYLRGHVDLGRFYVIMLSFMSSMLGLVLSDNLVALFVFWELTSVTSYLLIGFNHQDDYARKCALQGLIVSVLGGFALLSGIVLMGIYGGSYQISELLASAPEWTAAAPVAPIILCVLGGTFTKSAQFPFHFWLPNAMAAPTPVSAYLHSATMVKAGVYLMARLNPAFGDQALWTMMLSVFGGVTMLLGAWLSFTHQDAKKVLAYSTIMALGTLTMLVGIGTRYAMLGFAAFLVAHSLYKGALFMVAGILDHETGTKKLRELGGLRGALPVTTVAAALAGLSLAGVPPLFGFIGKELMLEGVLSSAELALPLIIMAVATAALTAGMAAAVAWKPFWGERIETPKHPHEAPWPMLAGPVVLAGLSLVFGLLPGLAEMLTVLAAAGAVAGAPIDYHFALWHGINTPLILSATALLLAVLVYRIWHRRQPAIRTAIGAVEERVGPETGYFKLMDGMMAFATWQTARLQNGNLGRYMIILIMTTVLLVGYTLLNQSALRVAFDLGDVRPYEWFIALLMATTALFAMFTRSRLAAVATMGVLGFTVALTFLLFSAPDLGITQVLVETLTVILLVLVLFRLPGFSRYSTRYEIVRDTTVALLFGVLMFGLMMTAINTRLFDTISGYYIDNSYLLAQGKNIVNVILVDFRALDTLGEIFVLCIAALGVYSMLKLRAEANHD